VKAGHPRAIGLLGFTVNPRFEVGLEVSSGSVKIEGEVAFEATITSTADREQRLLREQVKRYRAALVKQEGELNCGPT